MIDRVIVFFNTWQMFVAVLVTWVVIFCSATDNFGQGKLCPPNANDCIKVDFVDPPPNPPGGPATGYSYYVQVITDINNPAPFGVGKTYSDDFAFVGWGSFWFPNSTPGCLSPVGSSFRPCEYMKPDCPSATNPGLPAVFPSTAIFSAFTGNAVQMQFNTCCNPNPDE